VRRLHTTARADVLGRGAVPASAAVPSLDALTERVRTILIRSRHAADARSRAIAARARADAVRERADRLLQRSVPRQADLRRRRLTEPTADTFHARATPQGPVEASPDEHPTRHDSMGP
jgi:hypothetical protein